MNMLEVADRLLGTFRTELAENLASLMMDSLVTGWIVMRDMDREMWGNFKYRTQIFSSSAFGNIVIKELTVKILQVLWYVTRR